MKMSTRTIVTVGMFAAVISVLSILSIPMPSGVPVTLQTFAVALGGYVLGAKRGTAATVVYLLLGAVGAPVFAGMVGGLSCFVGYTGGFLWGFLFLALLCGVGIRRRNALLRLVCGMAGLLLCHFLGALQFSLVAGTSFGEGFLLASAPYLFKDVISVAGAYAAALPIRHALSAGQVWKGTV